MSANVGDMRESGAILVRNAVREDGVLASHVKEADALAVAEDCCTVVGQGCEESALPDEGDLLFVSFDGCRVVCSYCVAEKRAC